jgi:hypothetical protein
MARLIEADDYDLSACKVVDRETLGGKTKNEAAILPDLLPEETLTREVEANVACVTNDRTAFGLPVDLRQVEIGGQWATITGEENTILHIINRL